ncbi:hypothetical protein T03_3503 [Trichinella britovi]|uniref:Uncharacterized protein n=1 Tax=Trichinella britovi TaxID=45882 RepID=A0A0V1DIA8_TRIBR|nr:hypothetical protein T09_892 [Trichinella sp. T9]KRX65843.1 hypothetical protein T09_15161 [Trichinella sp. T9]KRY61078.1 hypothetical protein T03_3503 [Trichinella britovi]
MECDIVPAGGPMKFAHDGNEWNMFMAAGGPMKFAFDDSE